MTILRHAYVKVAPDTSKFDRELKDQLRGVKADEPGDRVGKTFSSSLTRRIDRELKKFDLPTLDLTANPADAVKAIEITSKRLEALRDDADSIELRMHATKALGDLGRFRKQFGDVLDDKSTTVAGVKAGSRLAAGIGDGLAKAGGRITEGLGQAFGTLPPQAQVAIGAAVVTAIGASSVLIGATVSGAVVGGLTSGVVAGGVAAAFQDSRVKAAGASLADDLRSELFHAAGAFVPATLGAIGQVRAELHTIGPQLKQAFDGAARFVKPLTSGLLDLVRNTMPGVIDSLGQAGPVIEAIRRGLGILGTSFSNALRTISGDADDSASALLTMFRVVGYLVEVAATAVRGLTELYGIFRWGTALVTGDAKAIALLAAEKAGATKVTDDFTAALSGFIDGLAETERNTKAVQAAQEGLAGTLAGVGVQGTIAKTRVDALRQAQELLYGATTRNSDANQTWEASWDTLQASVLGATKSVKDNNTSLNIHTEAGRANRSALIDLIKGTNELYFSEIETGKSVAEATKKHNDRITAIKEEAKRLGLNKTQTELLIKAYGKIPPAKTTDLILKSVDNVADALLDLAAIQLHLANGTRLPADLQRRLARAQYGMPDTKRAFGGPLPGHAPHDRADNAVFAGTPGEWVIQKPTVRKVEAAYGPGAMAHFNRTGELPGYATGGLLAASRADWRRNMLYATTAGMTKIPSLQSVIAAVTPNFGNWPSSPSAQRGDSGVWRRILAMVRGAGFTTPLVSSYRPGDPLWHGSGRADDFGGFNLDRLARFFLARQGQILEMIHRSGSRDYAYTRGKNKGRFNEALMNAHRGHLHIAMDDEGWRILQPGLNVIPNGTGRPEPIAGPRAIRALGGDVPATPAAMDQVVDLLLELIGAVRSVAPGVGREINGVGTGLRRLSRSHA